MKRIVLLIALFPILSFAAFGQCVVGNTVTPATDDPIGQIGQSFTATCTGVIEYVEIVCATGGTNTAGTLNIFSGSTVLGTPIHTQAYSATAVATGEALRIYLDVQMPVAVTNVRTFEVDMSLDVPYSSGNPYPGGRFFYHGPNGSVHARTDMEFNVSIVSNCTPTSASIEAEACEEYVSPSGQLWTETGIHSDTIPNIAGCDSVITVDLTVNTVDTMVTQSGAELSASLSDAEYQWLDCDDDYAIIPGAIEQSFTPDMNGSYAVIVTGILCADTSSCHMVLSTGLSDSMHPSLPGQFDTRSGMFHLFPNQRISMIEVFDLLGHRVATDRSNSRSMDLSYLLNGTYVVAVHTMDGATLSQRMMLMR